MFVFTLWQHQFCPPKLFFIFIFIIQRKCLASNKYLISKLFLRFVIFCKSVFRQRFIRPVALHCQWVVRKDVAGTLQYLLLKVKRAQQILQQRQNSNNKDKKNIILLKEFVRFGFVLGGTEVLQMHSTRGQQVHYGILKSNSSMFPQSKGYITEDTPQGVYGLIINENIEVNISLMIVKMI